MTPPVRRPRLPGALAGLRGRWLNLGLAAVLTAVVAVAYLVVGDPDTSTAAATRTATADRGDVTAAVSGTGNLSSARSRTLSFGASGTVTEVSVEAGATVTKGQLLAAIDDGAATRALSSAKAQLASAEASYDEVTAGQTDAEREKDELSVESAELSLNSAQAALKQAEKQPAPDATAVSKAKQDVLQAKSQLAQAEAEAATNAAGATDAQVASAKVSVEEAAAGVADAEAALDGTTLRAPFAGTVVSVSGAVGDSVTAGSSGSSSTGSTGSTGSGSSGSSGTSGSGGSGDSSSDSSGSSASSGGFIVLSDVAKLRVTANVAEADIGSVKAGQPASVTLSAAGETVEGTVTAVSPEGTTSSNVVQYPVTVELTTAPGGARLGASASVSITTGTASDVVRLSSSAITALGSRSTVSVVTNGVATVTPVETGLVGGGFTEITGGLTEGATVALPATSSGTTGSGGLPAFGPGLGGGGR